MAHETGKTAHPLAAFSSRAAARGINLSLFYGTHSRDLRFSRILEPGTTSSNILDCKVLVTAYPSFKDTNGL